MSGNFQMTPLKAFVVCRRSTTNVVSNSGGPVVEHGRDLHSASYLLANFRRHRSPIVRELYSSCTSSGDCIIEASGCNFDVS